MCGCASAKGPTDRSVRSVPEAKNKQSRRPSIASLATRKRKGTRASLFLSRVCVLSFFFSSFGPSGALPFLCCVFVFGLISLSPTRRSLGQEGEQLPPAIMHMYTPACSCCSFLPLAPPYSRGMEVGPGPAHQPQPGGRSHPTPPPLPASTSPAAGLLVLPGLERPRRDAFWRAVMYIVWVV